VNRREEQEEADSAFSADSYEEAAESLKAYALRGNAYAQLYLVGLAKQSKPLS
jgi:hypothetical protein